MKVKFTNRFPTATWGSDETFCTSACISSLWYGSISPSAEETTNQRKRMKAKSLHWKQHPIPIQDFQIKSFKDFDVPISHALRLESLAISLLTQKFLACRVSTREAIFARARVFRSLYYPPKTQGTTRSLKMAHLAVTSPDSTCSIHGNKLEKTNKQN